MSSTHMAKTATEDIFPLQFSIYLDSTYIIPQFLEKIKSINTFTAPAKSSKVPSLLMI